MRWILGIFIAISVGPLGCGGSSTSDDAPAGGTAGTGGTAATGGSAGTGGSAASGGGGAGGSGGTAACAGFEDETPPPQVWTVRLINARPSPIYLGGGSDCGSKPLFQLDGPDGPVKFSADNCENTCEELQQHGPYCTGACMIPPIIFIQPGGHYDASWSGTTFETMNMPGECYFQKDSPSASCDRRAIAPEGTYEVQAQAFTELVCSDVSMCSCTPDASGSCQISYGGSPSGQNVSGKTELAFPSESLVELKFL